MINHNGDIKMTYKKIRKPFYEYVCENDIKITHGINYSIRRHEQINMRKKDKLGLYFVPNREQDVREFLDRRK